MVLFLQWINHYIVMFHFSLVGYELVFPFAKYIPVAAYLGVALDVPYPLRKGIEPDFSIKCEEYSYFWLIAVGWAFPFSVQLILL